MGRDDEIEALLDIYKLYDGNLSDFHPTKTPPEIKVFLKRRPSLPKLQAALIAVLAGIRAQQRQKSPTLADRAVKHTEEALTIFEFERRFAELVRRLRPDAEPRPGFREELWQRMLAVLNKAEEK